VGPEKGGLVGHHGVAGRVGLAEAVALKAQDDGPDLLDDFFLHSPFARAPDKARVEVTKLFLSVLLAYHIAKSVVLRSIKSGHGHGRLSIQWLRSDVSCSEKLPEAIMKQSIILVADPYPPYQYLESGEVAGVDHDLIQSAFRVHNLDIDVSLYPWDRCLQLIESAEADGLFQIQPTPEREKQFIFSDPLRIAQTVFLQNVSNPIDLAQYDTLSRILDKHNLGLVKDYSYHPEIDDLRHQNKVMVSSQEALLKGISKNDFELALMDRGVAEYLSGTLGITNVSIGAGFEIERRLHVAFRKGLVDIVRLFNSGLREVERKGLRQTIYSLYKLSD
jgi:polar amino acid transport system substrate-binding protein